jgi:hypothetical protein
MSSSTIRRWRAAIVIGVLVAAAGANAQRSAPPPSAEKQRMIDLGIEHKTARGLYDYLKKRASGGAALTARTTPDWTGVWTRASPFFFWDPDQGAMDVSPTSKLTPQHEKLFREKMDRLRRGIEFDPLSKCEPAGMPRWLSEPFLRDFVVTPQQTWLITEQQNEIRRIYTDGRDHPPAEDAYPLWEGDSIGFWDGDKLVIHTNSMRAGQYQRMQPFYTEQVEVVEIWQKTAADTLTVDVWTYDPPALVEPWYVRITFKRLSNEDKSLRIRYWDCNENQNNVVTQTETGTSDFKNFTFTEKDDKK